MTQSQINLDQIYTKKSDLVWREVDEEVVIVSPDSGDVRALNLIGSRIWVNLDGKQSLELILKQLVNDFPSVSTDRLQQDLLQFIASLNERHMIKLV